MIPLIAKCFIYLFLIFSEITEDAFRIKASISDGYSDEEGTILRNTISQPFWETWPNLLIYIIVGSGILFFFRRYEMSRLELKNRIKLNEAVLKEREETDRLKSRFFANISHEFRTPLTLILGPSEKITPNSNPEEIQKQTRLIKRNARRLILLIDQLLDLSKLEAGKLKLKVSKNNIVSFIKGIVMSFESLAERKGISLRINCDKEEIELYFDREMMMKILTNLMSNAIKFTPEGGTISVSINQENAEKIKITVKDSGIGIPVEEVPKLFNMFYQVDNSQTRENKGTGLGLAISKELVELHQGYISVKSKVGEGSEFILEFPAGKDHYAADQIIEEQLPALEVEFIMEESSYQKKPVSISGNGEKSINGNRSHILLVEDNMDVREYIRDILFHQYLVDEAANGQQGLEKAKEKMPDLIISDIMMPEMDGIEFCRIIKTEFLTSHIPLILLTAKAAQDNKIEGLETGADDYILKPFDPKELLVRIDNLLGQRRLLKEKFSRDFILQPEKISTNKTDSEFLKRICTTIEKNLGNENLDSESLASNMFMSRMNLHRKLQAITGQGPGEFIRTYKLKRAAQMLKENKLSITQIAFEVGYCSPSHFSKAFIKHFNCSPSEYIKVLS